MAEAKVSVTHLTPTQLGYILVLKEDNGERVLAIKLRSHQDYLFVELALEGRNTSHGTPHDTMKEMLVALEGVAEKVVIVEPEIRDLNKAECVATIYLRKGNRSIPIGSSSVDAIAFALKTHCPIFAEDSIFTRAVDHHSGNENTAGGPKILDWLSNLDLNSFVTH